MKVSILQVMKHMVMSMHRKDVQWIKHNFSCRKCEVFVSKKETGKCFCGKGEEDHEIVPTFSDKAEKEEVKWNPQDNTVKEQTDSMGRVLFNDDYQFASR